MSATGIAALPAGGGDGTSFKAVKFAILPEATPTRAFFRDLLSVERFFGRRADRIKL